MAQFFKVSDSAKIPCHTRPNDTGIVVGYLAKIKHCSTLQGGQKSLYHVGQNTTASVLQVLSFLGNKHKNRKKLKTLTVWKKKKWAVLRADPRKKKFSWTSQSAGPVFFFSCTASEKKCIELFQWVTVLYTPLTVGTMYDKK